MSVDLETARKLAVDVTREAGRLVRSRLYDHWEVRKKGMSGDIVTDLDIAAERLIIKTLRESFPGHRIVSEESGALAGSERWTWMVDPIDGTNNLAIGLPILAVGVALCREDVPIVGAVHDPMSGRTLSAIRGKGIYSEPGSLSLSVPVGSAIPESRREKPIIAWMQGYEVPISDTTAVELKAALSGFAHRLLELWAPMTCWAMLVRGDVDGLIGYRVGELDLFAGALLAHEAGLSLKDLAGNPFELRVQDGGGRCVFAAVPRFEDRLEQLVADVVGDCGSRRLPPS